MDLCLEEVNSGFLCSICADIMADPHQCKEGHAFCLKCITAWLQRSNSCPVCRSSLDEACLAKMRVVEGMINKLAVRCPNSSALHDPEIEILPANVVQRFTESNCSWKGEYGELHNHVSNHCLYSIVSCPNSVHGCVTEVQRKLLSDHLDICPVATVSCSLCNQSDLLRQDLPEHMKICDMVTVECANGCGCSHLRVHALEHDKSCRHGVIQCPFASHGCDFGNILRKDYEEHQVTKAFYHSELLAKGLQKLKEQLQYPSYIDASWSVPFGNQEPRQDYKLSVTGAGLYCCSLSIVKDSLSGDFYLLVTLSGEDNRISLNGSNLSIIETSVILDSSYIIETAVGKGSLGFNLAHFLTPEEWGAMRSADVVSAQTCLFVHITLSLCPNQSI